MRRARPSTRIAAMDSSREYDQDTVGDYDENTLDGSEGLDADTITTDGEDLTMDPPEEWKPAEENESLDDKLAAERPDLDDPAADRPAGDEAPRDEIDRLDPEGGSRVLGED